MPEKSDNGAKLKALNALRAIVVAQVTAGLVDKGANGRAWYAAEARRRYKTGQRAGDDANTMPPAPTPITPPSQPPTQPPPTSSPPPPPPPPCDQQSLELFPSLLPHIREHYLTLQELVLRMSISGQDNFFPGGVDMAEWWKFPEEFFDFIMTRNAQLSSSVETPCELWLLRGLILETLDVAATVHAHSAGAVDISSFLPTDEQLLSSLPRVVSAGCNDGISPEEISMELRACFVHSSALPTSLPAPVPARAASVPEPSLVSVCRLRQVLGFPSGCGVTVTDGLRAFAKSLQSGLSDEAIREAWQDRIKQGCAKSQVTPVRPTAMMTVGVVRNRACDLFLSERSDEFKAAANKVPAGSSGHEASFRTRWRRIGVQRWTDLSTAKQQEYMDRVAQPRGRGRATNGQWTSTLLANDPTPLALPNKKTRKCGAVSVEDAEPEVPAMRKRRVAAALGDALLQTMAEEHKSKARCSSEQQIIRSMYYKACGKVGFGFRQMRAVSRRLSGTKVSFSKFEKSGHCDNSKPGRKKGCRLVPEGKLVAELEQVSAPTCRYSMKARRPFFKLNASIRKTIILNDKLQELGISYRTLCRRLSFGKLGCMSERPALRLGPSVRLTWPGVRGTAQQHDLLLTRHAAQAHICSLCEDNVHSVY